MKIAIIAAILATATAQTTFKQTNYYERECFQNPKIGQPLVIDATPSPNCSTAVPNQKNCLSDSTNPLGYKFYVNTCVNLEDKVDITGKVQQYVSLATYTGATCTGDVSRIQAFAADDLCHRNPFLQSNGFPFLRANCNGQKPYVWYCQDSNCTMCTNKQQYDLGCNPGNINAQCIINRNAGSSSTDGDEDSEDGRSDSSAAGVSPSQGMMMAVGVAAAAAGLLL